MQKWRKIFTPAARSLPKLGWWCCPVMRVCAPHVQQAQGRHAAPLSRVKFRDFRFIISFLLIGGSFSFRLALLSCFSSAFLSLCLDVYCVFTVYLSLFPCVSVSVLMVAVRLSLFAVYSSASYSSMFQCLIWTSNTHY